MHARTSTSVSAILRVHAMSAMDLMAVVEWSSFGRGRALSTMLRAT